MIKPTILLWTALLLLLLTGVAIAQDRMADRRKDAGRLLERFDTDGDGRLSADEREAMREAITRFRGGGQHEPRPQTVVPGETDLYRITPGPHAIAAIDTHLLHDPDPGKDIPLRITFPTEGGPHPVVVFCHGAMGSKDAAQPLVTHWAAHGYVVIQPTFGDSISLMTPEQKRAVRSLTELVNSEHVKREWDQRPADVAHVLDSLGELERALPELAGRMDTQRIVIGGHSYGAHTTMLLSGLTLTDPRSGRSLNLREPRIDAAFLISPQGPGGAISEASYETLEGPMLMITGDHDGTPIHGREDKAGAWRRIAFDQAPPGEKHLLWIRDAHHGFGGMNGRESNWPGAGPDAPDHVFYVKSTVLAFMDATVRQDPEAAAYLDLDRLSRATDGEATLTSK